MRALPALRSPTSGAPLAFEAPHALVHGRERWPVVAGIPYLRTGRDELRARVLEQLDAGRERAALVELLGDQDDWAPAPPPPPERRAEALDAPTLRDAMAALGFGAVGAYFAFRWSDPTFLSGLALLQAVPRPARVFELACGIGQFGRELTARGVEVIGADVVWSKLWLARRFVAPEAALVCFDAGAPFPLEDATAELAFCHDALHYLPDPAAAVSELRRIAGPDGSVAIGHAHNAAVDNLSAGAPLNVDGYAELLDDPLLFDDAELTSALVDGRSPRARAAAELAGCEAVGLLHRPPADGGVRLALGLPPAGAALRLNPLLRARSDGRGSLALEIRWPSPRYEREYAARSGFLREAASIPADIVERAGGGAAGGDDGVDELARRRVLLDLPAAW